MHPRRPRRKAQLSSSWRSRSLASFSFIFRRVGLVVISSSSLGPASTSALGSVMTMGALLVERKLRATLEKGLALGSFGGELKQSEMDAPISPKLSAQQSASVKSLVSFSSTTASVAAAPPMTAAAPTAAAAELPFDTSVPADPSTTAACFLDSLTGSSWLSSNSSSGGGGGGAPEALSLSLDDES